MLRVGLTGELGSGKSTVAQLLGERGAVVLSSDELARAMMQPGEAAYAAILERFGPGVVRPDGTLDRRELSRLAFDPSQPRVEELNAIVHPAVLSAQERRIAEIGREQPGAIVVVESALIFTTKAGVGGEPWRGRFDQIVLVTAPEPVKLERFVERVRAGQVLSTEEIAMIRADAERRLEAQRIPPELARGCLVVENEGGMADLEKLVDLVWERLQVLASA